MSWIINEHTVNGETDRRVEVSTGNALVRTLAVGNNWTRVRVGMRLSWGDNGYASDGGSGFWLYFSTADDQTSHCIGVRTVGGAWDFGNNGRMRDSYRLHTVSSSRTDADLLSSGFEQLYIPNRDSFRGFMGVEIEKGSPYILRNLWTYDGAPSECTKQNFADIMNSTNWWTGTDSNQVITLSGGAYYYRRYNGFTPNEATNGYFDRAACVWSNASNPIEVCDFTVKVMA